MRTTILILALVALVANVNGSSIAGKIKEALTPSSMQEHEKKPEQQLPQQLPSSSFDQQQQNIQRENLPQQQQNIPRENLPQQQNIPRENLPQQQQHGFMQPQQQQPQSARSGQINVEQKRMEQQRMPENVNPNLPMTGGRQEHAQEQMNLPKMDQKNIGMQQPSDIRHGQRFQTSEQQPQLKSQAFGSNPSRDVVPDQQAAGQTWWGTRTYQYSWPTPTYSPRYVYPQYQYPVYHSHPGGDMPHYHAGGGTYFY